jgi:hypothetical protein
MWTPLSACSEYEAPRPTLTLVVPVKLEPVDYRILTLLFRGAKLARIAALLGRSLQEVATRTDRLAFRQLQAEVEAGVVRQITSGRVGEPTSIAKAAAPAAMRQVVKLSATCHDPRTRLQASKSVLEYAGVEPPRQVEVTTPDRILDQMTAAELLRFAERRVWPERFRDLLRAFLPAPAADLARSAPGETVVEMTATPPPPVEEPPGGADEEETGSATAYDQPDDPPPGASGGRPSKP